MLELPCFCVKKAGNIILVDFLVWKLHPSASYIYIPDTATIASIKHFMRSAILIAVILLKSCLQINIKISGAFNVFM